MAVELAKAYITLVPSFQGAQGAIAKELGDAGSEGGKAAGGGFKSTFAGVLGGTFVGNLLGDAFKSGTRALVGSIKDAIGAVANWETINAQSASAIQATGQAAGVTAEHINDLANSLEMTTSTEAESIQQGENLLLTFKNIKNGVGDGNDVFDQATKSLVDMARAMGQDPKDAAIQLGKALNDPIAGISALSRVGVTFTEDQKAVIESLVETGDVAGAQKIILAELNSEFGGAGEAYGGTYAGMLDSLKNKFGDLTESIATALMPALGGIAGALLSGMEAIEGSAAFNWVLDKLTNFGGDVATKLNDLSGVIVTLNNSSAGFTLPGLLDSLSQSTPAMAILVPLFEALAPVVPTLATAMGQIAPSLADLLIALVPIIPPLTDLVIQILPPLADLLSKIAPGIAAIVQASGPVIGVIAEQTSALGGMVNMLTTLTSGSLPDFLGEVGKVPGVFGFALQSAQNLGTGFGTVFGNIVVTVRNAFGAAKDAEMQFINATGQIFGNLGNLLYSSGRSLVQGFINGILGMIRNVRSAASDVMQAVANFFPHSPAKDGPFSGAGWRAVATSGSALLDQFTSGFGADVAPTLMGSVAGSLSARSVAVASGGGGGAGMNFGDTYITTSRPADEAFVSKIREQQFLFGMG